MKEIFKMIYALFPQLFKTNLLFVKLTNEHLIFINVLIVKFCVFAHENIYHQTHTWAYIYINILEINIHRNF
jgi:hypothetical protein